MSEETRTVEIVAEFISAIFNQDDLVEVRMLPSGERDWCKASEIHEKLAYYNSRNLDGQNIYFGANPRTRKGGSATEDVATFRCLFVDFDNVSADYARTIISNQGLPTPTAEVHSGHGVHIYWRLEEPISDPEVWSAYQRGLIAACGSDPKIKDPPRIMRLPGFLNVKYDPHVECKSLSIHLDAVYELNDVGVEPLENIKPASTATPREIEMGQAEPHPATIYFMKQGAPAGERNSRLFTAACDLSGRGYTERETMDLLVRPAMNSGLTPTEIETSIKSAYSKPRTPREDDDDTIESCIQRMIYGTDESRERASGTGRKYRPTVSNVADLGTGDESRRCYITAPKICEMIQESNDGWPRLVNGMMFVLGDKPPEGELPSGGSIRYITNEAAFFAYLLKECDIRWTSRECVCRDTNAKRNTVTKKEMHEYMCMEAKPQYKSVEILPHFPEVDGVYYLKSELPEPTGHALDELISRFNPETDYDRQLMLAALVTPGWGGPPGTRPAFVFTSRYGRGVGKTTTASLICEIWGGAPSISEREDWEAVRARLLSDESLSQRCVLIDNLKSRLSRGGLESAITARTMDGKKMYKGQFSRPNYLTWFITANTPTLSRDLAERSIIINVGQPQHSNDFNSWKENFIKENRAQLISDIMHWLEQPSLSTISSGKLDRWATWQRAIIGKFDNADAVITYYQALRPEVDSDLEEAEEVAKCICDLIRRRGYSPITDAVRMPKKILVNELRDQDVIDNSMSPKGCTTWIKNMMTLEPLEELKLDRRHGKSRCWVWYGDEHKVGDIVYDIPEYDSI